MFDVRANVIFESATGLPKDRVVNTFHFHSPTKTGLSSPEASGLTQLIEDFYVHVQTGTSKSILSFLSTGLVYDPDPLIEFYDDNAVGSPVGTGSLLGVTAPTASGDPLPREVALCLSFAASLTGLVEEGPVVTTLPTDAAAVRQGAPTTHSGRTRPKARHRGRIYLGPFGAAALTPGSASDSRPLASLVSTVTAAAARLRDNAGAFSGVDDFVWSVRSKRDGASYPVLTGWVDNAWDTQRRRGIAATARTTF